MTEYLTLDSLLQVAEAAIDGDVQVRDHGLLASAVARPRTTVFGADAYPETFLALNRPSTALAAAIADLAGPPTDR